MSKTNKIHLDKKTFFTFPYLAISIIFVIIPLIILFTYAFIGSDGSFTLSNFHKFYGPNSRVFWKAAGNSFSMAFLTTLICLLLCYPLALALNRVKTNKTAVLVMIFVLPMWINSLLRIISIKLLFGSRLGYGVVLIGMVYDFLPFMLLPLYTIIVNTNQSLIEASFDLGASPLKTLIKVRLPLSIPGIISGALMVFMPTMSTFAVSEILSGSKISLFGNLIENRYRIDKGEGSAYSIVLMLLIVVSMLIASSFSKSKSVKGGTVSL